ncbi:kinase-like protein [Pseudovirgaria hyperparasitica]|uniref:Kinase-like protein n=1 Tax=Pseudovirgaria hyperparasitica TaxID=470096 RepID=A0A6A6WHY6_9PEZI|nr:kinase-like protein [Pseudovirgaria hyperparasitica]KAF2762408.1 kinase-like protein [Pseudovirgaria hyperparasitica]
MADAFKTRTMKRKNVKGLALSAPQPKALAPSAGDAQIPGAIGNDEGRTDTLEIGVEFRLDLKAEDLLPLKELGSGNGGTVSKVQHAATKVVMARKVIHVEAKNEIRKRIVRELRIMHDCNSEYIVDFYGAFQNESGDVVMCMEYMNTGSLDYISKTFGPVRVDVLGKIAEAVLGGLTYLWTAHRIMHRDLKPSNILVNSRGHIKLCDFGVSSELEGSIAETFVGTGTYMAPERIQGSPYTVKSDVWSVGLSLMELAIGKFPFGSDNDGDEPGGPQGILDLLQQIVLEPAPKLPKSDAFPSILEDMIAKCMMKDPNQRPSPQELYEHDAFLLAAKRTPVDLEAWAVSMMERQNRRSHLGPIPSPSTRALLREGTASPSATPAPEKTPTAETNGKIPASMRPSLPLRTSSASQVPRETSTMSLPIRPAPPPAGPLPQVPRKPTS